VPEVLLPTLRVEELASSPAAEGWIIANRDPAPAATGVSRLSTVVLEVLDLRTLPIPLPIVRVSIDDLEAYDSSRVPSIDPDFGGYRARVEVGSDILRITLDPLRPLSSQARVQIAASVGTGSDAVRAEWSFEVEDYTAPTLLAAEAVSPARILLSFDEVVSADQLAAALVAIERPAVPLTVVGSQGSGTQIELTVQPEMTPSVLYELRARGARDDSANESIETAVRFRGYRPSVPAERQFDLWKMLPLHARRADETTDLARFIRCLQEIVDLVLLDIDRMADRLDIERAAESVVEDWLSDLGSPFELVLSELDKRRLASSLVALYRLKGTEKGLRAAARFLLGIELEEVTTFSGTPLTLGESLLGVDWELGPSSRFALYAFSVRVPRMLTAEERQRLRTLILWCRPAHTHLIEIQEPSLPAVLERWELGIAELGLNTVLG